MTQKPQLVFYLFLIFIFITIALFTIQSQFLKNVRSAKLLMRRIVKEDLNDDISCHYNYSKDSLPSAEDIIFGRNSIFFHETSCRGGLTSRQACVVESAARLHPNRSVYVLFSASVTEENLQRSYLKLLSELNVKFLRIHLPEYAKGTGLKNILMKQINKESDYQIEHSSDILRFITLYKYGGVYLDTDVLVVKRLDALGKNWAVRQSKHLVSDGTMAAAEDGIGHEIFKMVLEQIRKDYRPRHWSHNGPGAITRTLQKYCDGDTNIRKFSAEKCQGFEVYNRTVFYMIPFRAFRLFFKPGRIRPNNTSYGFHFWNKLSRTLAIMNGSLIHDLATKHCPGIVNYFEDDFGF